MTRSLEPGKRPKAESEKTMQLVQIGSGEPEKTISIRELFEQLARDEEQMIREARERMEKRATSNA